jgi:hypothetical protein
LPKYDPDIFSFIDRCYKPWCRNSMNLDAKRVYPYILRTCSIVIMILKIEHTAARKKNRTYSRAPFNFLLC